MKKMIVWPPRVRVFEEPVFITNCEFVKKSQPVRYAMLIKILRNG